MKILVTGASGFLGAYLSMRLLEEGNEVISIKHDLTPMNPAKALGIENEITWCKGDILDGNLVKRVIADYEVQLVYHLAALPIVQVGLRTTVPMFETNLMGTLNVLEALKEEYLMAGYDIPLVHMSTDKVYGITDWGRKYLETDPLNAEIPYEASKACADIAVRTYKSSGYIGRASVVRPSNIYGPGDMNNRIIPNTIRFCLNGKPPQLWRNYTYVREYTFADDWVDAMEAVAKYTFDVGGDIFNIGSEVSKTQGDVISEISSHFGIEPIVVEPPDYTKKEIPYQALDHSKIRKTLGWAPKTCFEDGITETVDWWKVFDWKGAGK
jgi:CDP-glucose 4,6-dehydratase